MSAQPRPLRRLNRTQIQEILERNIGLYREEENFAPYIVDLALYLLEYEYDWAESGIEPPPHIPQPQRAVYSTPSLGHTTPVPTTPVPSHHTPYPGVNSSALTPPRSPGVSTPPRPVQNGAAPLGERKIISPQLRPRETTPPGGLGKLGSNPSIATSCPHCGTPIHKESTCPSCRNLVR